MKEKHTHQPRPTRGEGHQYHCLPHPWLLLLGGLQGSDAHEAVISCCDSASSVTPPEEAAWGSSWGAVTLFRNMSMVVRLICFFLFSVFFNHRLACKQIMHYEYCYQWKPVWGSMFSNFLKSLLRSFKAFRSTKPFTMNFLGSSSFPSVVSFSLALSSAMHSCSISQFFRNHFQELLSVILIHSQVKLFVISTIVADLFNLCAMLLKQLHH